MLASLRCSRGNTCSRQDAIPGTSPTGGDGFESDEVDGRAEVCPQAVFESSSQGCPNVGLFDEPKPEQHLGERTARIGDGRAVVVTETGGAGDLNGDHKAVLVHDRWSAI
jgi:hypothetical protein